MNEIAHPGDTGQTHNFAGETIHKNSHIINTIGNIDELIAYIGLIRYILPQENTFLQTTQQQLSSFAAELTKYPSSQTYQTVEQLDSKIVFFQNNSPKITDFYLPGEQEKPIFINITRTICRRTERSIVNIKPIPEKAEKYLNRLSTYLFALQIYYHFLSESNTHHQTNQK